MILLFAIITIFTIAVTVGAHYLFYQTLVTSFGLTSPGGLIFLKTILFILPLGFIVASILLNRFTNIFIRGFYLICSVWLGFIFYLTVSCLLLRLIIFLNKSFLLNLNIEVLTALLFLAAFAVVIYGIFASQNIKIKKIEVAMPNLPVEWQGKTTVYLSDLHLGAVDNVKFATRLAGLIDNLRPDLLLIGGDFYDGQKNINLLELAQTFSKIKAPLGKFFITGNHEEFDGQTEFTDALTKAGITYLNNQLVDINGLQLIGVDYKTAYSQNNFAAILENLKIDKNKPSILLRHVPDKIRTAAEAGISLVLCGHTHRGQLFPSEVVTQLLYNKFSYGLNKSGDTSVYTSSGAGTWGPPMRILADPEVVVIKFK